MGVNIMRNERFKIYCDVPNPKYKDEVYKRFEETTSKFYGRKQDESNIMYLKAELNELARILYEEGKIYNFRLNDGFATSQTWRLSDVLNIYKKAYPDRFKKKKHYTKIDVNNMLFDLKIKGILASYESILPCYQTFIEMYGEEPFDENTLIHVQFISEPLDYIR